MRFVGNIEAKTDAKGRVFLPSAFRKLLQTAAEEGLVLRKDIFHRHLILVGVGLSPVGLGRAAQPAALAPQPMERPAPAALPPVCL